MQNQIKTPLISPNDYKYPQIAIILLSTVLLIGKNYCFNLPQSLESQFLKGEMRLTNLQFDLFYSVYSFPNIVLPLFGGVFIDKLGNRVSLFIFSLSIAVGQLLFLFGTSLSNYGLMIFGRVVFGLGSENLLIVQHTVIVKWADKRYWAVSIALQAAIAKIGAIVNSPLTPMLYDRSQGFFVPMFVGLVFCVLSFVSGLFVCLIDKRFEGRLDRNEEKRERMVSLKVLKELDSRYWTLCLQSALIFGSYTAFTANENHILTRLFGMSSSTAGDYLLIIYFISLFLPPIVGLLTDHYARKPSIILFLHICFISCVLMLIFLPSDCPHPLISIPLTLHGIFLGSFFPIVWTCVPMIAKKEGLGTAYGVLASMVNCNQAVSPIIFGVIEDNTHSNYFWALVFVTFQAVLGVFAAVGLLVADFRSGETLEKVRK